MSLSGKRGNGGSGGGYQRAGGDVYQAAGAVLTRLEEKKDSTLKAACLQSPFQGKKMLTALVSQTVRYGAVIEALLEVRWTVRGVANVKSKPLSNRALWLVHNFNTKTRMRFSFFSSSPAAPLPLRRPHDSV